MSAIVNVILWIFVELLGLYALSCLVLVFYLYFIDWYKQDGTYGGKDAQIKSK